MSGLWGICSAENVLRLLWSYPKHQCGLGADLLKSSSVEPGSPDGQQADYESAMGPCGQKGQWDPGVHLEERCQHVKGGDPPPLLSPGEATPGLLCPDLGSSVQEGHRTTRVSSEEGYEDG